MDYIISEATLNDVPTIVEITMQSFEDAFQKPFYHSRADAVHRWTAYMCKEHYLIKAEVKVFTSN